MPSESDKEKISSHRKALQLYHRLSDPRIISGRLKWSQMPVQNHAYYAHRYGERLDTWSFEELAEAFEHLIVRKDLPVSNDSDTSLKMHNLLIALAEKIATPLQKNTFLKLAKTLTNNDFDTMSVPRGDLKRGKPTVEGLTRKILLTFRKASDNIKSNRQAPSEKPSPEEDKRRNQVLRKKGDTLITTGAQNSTIKPSQKRTASARFKGASKR